MIGVFFSMVLLDWMCDFLMAINTTYLMCLCVYIHGSRWSKAISDMHRRDFPLKCLELLMKVLKLLRSTKRSGAHSISLSISNWILSSVLLLMSRIFPFAFSFSTKTPLFLIVSKVFWALPLFAHTKRVKNTFFHICHR